MNALKAEDIDKGKTVYFAGKKIRGIKVAAEKSAPASPPVKSAPDAPAASGKHKDKGNG